MLSVQVSSSVAPFSGASPLEFSWYALPVFLCYCFPLKLFAVFSVFCLRTSKLIFIHMFHNLLFLTNVTQLSFLSVTPVYLNLKNVPEISLDALITDYVANCIKELLCRGRVLCILCVFQGIFFFT